MIDPPAEVTRVAYLGSPAIAVPPLDALIDAGFDVPLVVSGADKRRGRGRGTSPTAVKQRALDLGLAVTDDLDTLHTIDVDLVVVVAFGQIIGLPLLEKHPMVNIHFSDLPRWRGAAPVERSILAGDTSSAVCIIDVAEGLDEGDVFARRNLDLTGDETLFDLWSTMSTIGAELLVETINAGFPTRTPQSGEVIYAHKLNNADRQIDWSASATEIHRIIRVGGAWTLFRGERFKVHEAQLVQASTIKGETAPGTIKGTHVKTGDAELTLTTVQPAGKPKMAASDWVNGAQPDGELLGQAP